MSLSSNARVKLGLLIVMIMSISGCGKPRTGQVTVNGQLLDSGQIQFTPDLDQGNSGPSCIALVKDGKLEFLNKAIVTNGPVKLLAMVPKSFVKPNKNPEAAERKNEKTILIEMAYTIPAEGELNIALEYKPRKNDDQE